MAEFIRNVNLLYHEATFQTDMEEWAAKTMHSTARQAAQIAVKANAGKLIIGHFSNRYKTNDSFLTEAREMFPNTDLATEGQRFKVE